MSNNSPRHDLTPDGRTGPFMRERHDHREGALVLDPRCGPCSEWLGKGENAALDAIHQALTGFSLYVFMVKDLGHA